MRVNSKSASSPAVYVMATKRSGWYKIGSTRNFVRRYRESGLTQLRLLFPVLADRGCIFPLERELQRMFAHRPVLGRETFHLTKNDLRMLHRMRRRYQPIVAAVIPGKVKCSGCGYAWESRIVGTLPKECPQCKRRNWR